MVSRSRRQAQTNRGFVEHWRRRDRHHRAVGRRDNCQTEPGLGHRMSTHIAPHVDKTDNSLPHPPPKALHAFSPGPPQGARSVGCAVGKCRRSKHPQHVAGHRDPPRTTATGRQIQRHHLDCPVFQSTPTPQTPQRAPGLKAGRFVGLEDTRKKWALVRTKPKKCRLSAFGQFLGSGIVDPTQICLQTSLQTNSTNLAKY